MNKIFKQFTKQAKNTIDDNLSINFCSYLLSILFYTKFKLTPTCDKTFNIHQDVFQILVDILEQARNDLGVNKEKLNQIIVLTGIDQNIYFDQLCLYIEIYCLHIKLKPFYYFYDKKYNIENDKESIDLMQVILDKISQFNNQCISLLINRYADVIKFAKLSWLDISKYVK